MSNAIEKAIREAGTMEKLAERLNEAGHTTIKRQHIGNWKRAGRVPVFPVNRVLDVERITGVPRHELNPEAYPPEEYGGAA